MIFELDHQALATALKEYMDKRDIAVGKQCTFTLKTSRKGDKTSRVIVTTVDTIVAKALEAAVAAPVVTLVPEPTQAPMSFVEALTQPEEVVVAEQEEVKEIGEVKASPFKKLFAA
jgi:hypothetical protein